MAPKRAGMSHRSGKRSPDKAIEAAAEPTGAAKHS
jgi:hypothetical protein